MQSAIQKWGNSLALRIPRGYAKDMHIAAGAPVEISMQEGKIIIDPHPVAKYSLQGLLKGVTAKNRHSEVTTGRPVGLERFS